MIEWPTGDVPEDVYTAKMIHKGRPPVQLQQPRYSAPSETLMIKLTNGTTIWIRTPGNTQFLVDTRNDQGYEAFLPDGIQEIRNGQNSIRLTTPSPPATVEETPSEGDQK